MAQIIFLRRRENHDKRRQGSSPSCFSLCTSLKNFRSRYTKFPSFLSSFIPQQHQYTPFGVLMMFRGSYTTDQLGCDLAGAHYFAYMIRQATETKMQINFHDHARVGVFLLSAIPPPFVLHGVSCIPALVTHSGTAYSGACLRSLGSREIVFARIFFSSSSFQISRYQAATLYSDIFREVVFEGAFFFSISIGAELH